MQTYRRVPVLCHALADGSPTDDLAGNSRLPRALACATLAQIEPPLTQSNFTTNTQHRVAITITTTMVMTTAIIVNMYAHVNQSQNDTTKLQMTHKNYEYKNATSESGVCKINARSVNVSM